MSSHESSITIEGTEVDNVDNQFSLFRECVLEGRWKEVLELYKNKSDLHKIKINESRGTALHVAVNDGKEELVYALVDAILEHEGREVLRSDSALTSTNERGDTPLHLAASRGFLCMCNCIIGEFGERKDLIKVKNNKGETPLFRAVLTCHKKTFVYLYNVSKDFNVSLRNNDGDTILHHAIWREFLDLAIMITHCYPGLVDVRNKDGITPLEVLASKPSAFKSGSSLSWWKQIQYFCIPVGPLDAEKSIILYMAKIGKSEDREFKEATIQKENEAKKARPVTKAQTFVERKYATSVRFAKNVVRLVFKGLSLSGLGVTSQGGKAEFPRREDSSSGKNTTNEHDMNIMETAYFTAAINGIVEIVSALLTEITNRGVKEEFPKKEDSSSGKKTTNEHDINKKETAFFTAARNGVVEIVSALLTEIPSTIHETNCNNENVLLGAVKNGQTEVVEALQKNLDKKLFDSLILEVDNKENTVLHLAAGTTSKRERTWQRAGTAMQMMWDIKWYEYIRDLGPDHFTFRKNKEDDTPWEIFEQKHKELMNESSEWLKETSNSCSVVAALIAGVSFAASSTVPGGMEMGKPTFEGQPAFDAFAIASLIGLSFSVTALIMFLSILTSRKQYEDFRKSLPLKLLFGLTSLFVSIASMLVSFCAGHFFVLKDKYKNIWFPVYAATCLPITFYAVMQFPLYVDLLKAIFKKLPQRAKK